jgi:hypothetical protein
LGHCTAAAETEKVAELSRRLKEAETRSKEAARQARAAEQHAHEAERRADDANRCAAAAWDAVEGRCLACHKCGLQPLGQRFWPR